MTPIASPAAQDDDIAQPERTSHAAHVELQPVPDAPPGGEALLAKRLDLIGDLKVRLRAIVGEGDISVAELFQLKDGSVVPLEADTSPIIELQLDDRLVARGELVVVDDRLGVRITEVGSVGA
jgi:flagellar motor switch protein FliN/FliY